MKHQLGQACRRGRGAWRVAAMACMAAAAWTAPALCRAQTQTPTQTQTQTQVWDYVSYKRDRTSGQYERDNNTAGTLELIEKDGAARFRIIAGSMDVCHRGEIPATVERSAEATTITMVQAITGCPLFRYVIRNDGSGGVKEVQRDGRWVRERLDHGLTQRR